MVWDSFFKLWHSDLIAKAVRRLALLALLGGVFILGFVLWTPINSKLNCLLLIGSLFLSWTSALFFLWPEKWVRLGWIALPLCLLMLLLLPGRTPDPESLRARYLTALHSYEDSPYVWGGEARNGIDCSGLPRKSYRRALAKEGVTRLNGGLIRQACIHWFFDASARALGENYANYTSTLPIELTPIENVNTTLIEPGDIAITATGVHALVYTGDGHWIQAEPEKSKVVLLDGRGGESGWFRVPCRYVRWTELSATAD